MGVVLDAYLAEPDRAKRQAIKARALALLSKETYSQGIYTVTILDGPNFIDMGSTSGIDLTISVTRNGNPLPIDGHLRFFNPPIMVPDGSGGYTENLRAALRQIIVDAILAQKP